MLLVRICKYVHIVVHKKFLIGETDGLKMYFRKVGKVLIVVDSSFAARDV